MTRQPRRTAVAALAVAALIALTGCESTPEPADQVDSATTDAPSDSASTTPNSGRRDGPGRRPRLRTAADGTALAALAALPVKGRAAMTGYDRDQFGTEWSDAAGAFGWSRNGCDTRNDLLARDLQHEVVESNRCVVTSGVLAYEPYTGQKNYYFDKHDNDFATDLDGEHVVALGNAWATGAQQLSPNQRSELANDPINLMMVNPSLNRAKGDADFATWLPPNKAFRCSYAARQIRVKAAYGLWVTAPEKDAMVRVLATCPNEPLAQPNPQRGHKAREPIRQPAQAESTKPKQRNGGSAGSKSGSVYYENCDAARAAGAAPVQRGDPGYGSHLDGDGDGSACE